MEPIRLYYFNSWALLFFFRPLPNAKMKRCRHLCSLRSDLRFLCHWPHNSVYQNHGNQGKLMEGKCAKHIKMTPIIIDNFHS
uniref:Uncharacterized protein n=1 Tax=Arundo donax TaxID=35708 RepID=A0A0A9BNE0_ARUDO